MSILDGISFFDNLSLQEKDNLALFCQERFLKAGEVLFKEGDEATALYIVKSGKLRVHKERPDGDQTLGYIEQGEFVGEMAFFDGENIPKRRMASVKSLEETVLIVMMNYSITELARKRKDIYDKIAEVINDRKLKNELK
ncbi:MAG: cyclic nucleotide-binding domain-containing protein [Candidatus Gracilibacteria bacterium]|nr:cyclic nucleotide-binding domain-containing protein [Candidatus Gracilibacteria bacterium]MDD2909074.1 cyclic nucleotide-binding domain-containing protein [Candidatus Gracilibacteria bacterium]